MLTIHLIICFLHILDGCYLLGEDKQQEQQKASSSWLRAEYNVNRLIISLL